MYNPSEVGKKGSLFGLPYSPGEADLLVVPVGLDITVSYGEGTASSPHLILEESSQLDLSIPFIKSPWELKLALSDSIIDPESNKSLRRKAKKIIQHLEQGGNPSDLKEDLQEVNKGCEAQHRQIETYCHQHLSAGRLIGLLGGDHSAPLGLISALASKHEFGILQIDAHMDLRNSYEGFEYSHASIMYNALKLDHVNSLTQVGIRDFCEEEEVFVEKSHKPIHVFFDEVVNRRIISGSNWSNEVVKMIDTLPEKVYISFDIDGLNPSLCPSTGTPVAGGLDINQSFYLMEEVVKSGRKIIGFDLCEVGNGHWDANVGARVLYRLSTLMGVSNALLQFRDANT